MDIKDAYFAGLMDGEAWIALAKKRKSIRPRISVAMTCERTIRALHSHFGVGTVRSIPARNERCKPQWEWSCMYLGAMTVAARVRPFLIAKREAADRLLSYQAVGTGNGKKRRG